MRIGYAAYNNWMQDSEFIIFSVTVKQENGLLHLGLGFLGLGFELFINPRNDR